MVGLDLGIILPVSIVSDRLRYHKDNKTLNYMMILSPDSISIVMKEWQPAAPIIT